MNITRRHAIRMGATVTIGSAVFGKALAKEQRLAAGPMVTQESAGYQAQPKGDQRCSLCTHFSAPASCQIVQGTISPDGWCKLFRPKSS